MNTVHKATMLKKVRDNGEWKGYIAPSKVNAYNVNQGWHIGVEIIVTQLPNKEYAIVQEATESFTLLDPFIETFKHCNCNGELGNTVRFWES